jgi:hypothetical protein
LCLHRGNLKLITCIAGSPPTIEVQNFNPQTGVASAGYTLRPTPAGPNTSFLAPAVLSDSVTGEAQGEQHHVRRSGRADDVVIP